MTVDAFAAAVAARDAVALEAAASAGDARSFVRQLLPQMGPEACLWFWRVSMTPAQLRETSAAARAVMTQALLKAGFTPGQDFSAVREHGVQLLLLSDSARSFLLSELPADRHSSLLAFCSAVD